MDADERSICTYLKSYSGQFISGREICRRAGGKWRYREDPQWATPVLSRLVEKKLIEEDSTGHYRLIIKEGKAKPKKWVSPQIRIILERSGKDFGKTIEIEDPEEEI